MFSQWQGRFEQLSSGRFEGALKVVHGERVRVIEIEANQRVAIRGHDAGGLFQINPVTIANAASMWQGRQLTPGQLVVRGVETEVDHCSGRQTVNLGVSLRPEALVDAARSLLGTDTIALPSTWALFTPPTNLVFEFNDRLARFLKQGMADPSFVGTAESSQLEQECVRSLVAMLFENSTPQQRLSSPKRSRVVGLAEEFMRARLTESVGAIDLCRELGVNARTLRLTFRERYGVGPMTYFRFLRLKRRSIAAQVRSTRLSLGYSSRIRIPSPGELRGRLPSLVWPTSFGNTSPVVARWEP